MITVLWDVIATRYMQVYRLSYTVQNTCSNHVKKWSLFNKRAVGSINYGHRSMDGKC